MNKRCVNFDKSVIIWLFISFFLVIILTVVLALYLERDEATKVDRLLQDAKTKIVENTKAPFYRNYTLASQIVSNAGNYTQLEKDGPALLLPSTRFIALAPNGVVSEVFPKEENEYVIGIDAFGGNYKEVGAKAIETKALTISGPYKSVVDKDVIVGWLPVYLEAEKTDDSFWGLSLIAVNPNDIVKESNLNETIGVAGYSYTLFSYDESGTPFYFSEEKGSGNEKYLEAELGASDNPTYLRIFPLNRWYSFIDVWALLIAGFVISGLGAVVLHQNTVLRQNKKLLEEQLVRDVLTKILNRRGLGIEVERLVRLGKHFVVYFIDLNHFKEINDKYGHDVGDKALQLFASTVDALIDGSHIFARSGGDEFILIHVTDKHYENEMDEFFKKVDKTLVKNFISVDKKKISVSYSIGSAKFPEDGATFADVLRLADLAMYKNKKKMY